MRKNIVVGLLMTLAVALASGMARADEPSLHQVYQAAQSGNLSQAQSMMHEVLQAHPGSGKAHYVEAELLAKQGQFDKATAELATAERLAPGLPFAKPEAVQNLKGLLGSTNKARTTSAMAPVQSMVSPAAGGASFPWGLVAGGFGLIAFIVLATRLMASRGGLAPSGGYIPAGAPQPAGAGTGYGYGPGAAPYGAPGYGPVGPVEPGLGSRMMGGLATGAALGAGVVAGEALMHRFIDGREGTAHEGAVRNPADIGSTFQDTYFNDLGGNDFGVNDTSSWDDGGSDGGSDWN
ncbi:tetratricopeptide repeat protein [Oryzomicrobium sp.]|uniref:tetratricopeptide repeat protein n=1 Tax=Oryzomicrobium sp. TaxID=1911578 RepID=UPI0025CCD5C0|nr:tetratricopeptide repeat protein [Oryzomicrobium sp.]MCE1243451.1 tetratricopeptide repeat protein [Oryzomicrobium sp.]